MKKLSLAFLSAVSLVALTTGCSSSEVIEEGPALQTGAITFGATNVAKPSRAEVLGVLNNANFTEFHVFGCYTTGALANVQIFSGDVVTKGASSAWTYTGERYWLENATYNFYAYSCGNMEEKLSTSELANPSLVNGILEIQDFTLHANHDLVFAEVKNVNSNEYAKVENPQPINMEFKHILTRVKFSFKGEVPDNNYEISVSEVNINGLLNEATYNKGGNRRWMDYNDKLSEVALNVANDGKVPCHVGSAVNATNAATVACDPIFVIPNQEYKNDNEEDNVVNLTFKMTINRKNTVNGTTELIPVVQRTVTASWNPDWSQGKSVNNVITLSFQNATGLNPITFKAEILPTDGADDDNDTWVNETGDLAGLNFSSQAVVTE